MSALQTGCVPLGAGGFACSRASARPSCSVAGCGARAVVQCDHPLTGRRAGSTCSRYLCGAHRGQTFNGRDLCPAHAEMARAAR